jgi:adenine phosphoribosyltransferase
VPLSERLATTIPIVGGHADVWRLFDDAALLREVAAALIAPFRRDATKVAGIETRGLVLGTAAAVELGVGLVPIRKSERLLPGPKEVVESEAGYRGRRHTLRLQRAALRDRDRVLSSTTGPRSGARRALRPCSPRDAVASWSASQPSSTIAAAP